MGKNREWLNGCGIPLWVDENVLILILMMIAHICEYTKNTEFHTSKGECYGILTISQ